MSGNKVIHGKMAPWDKKSIGANYYENNSNRYPKHSAWGQRGAALADFNFTSKYTEKIIGSETEFK